MAVSGEQTLFGTDWVERARAAKGGNHGWPNEVISALHTTGGIYLSHLRDWFDRYPLTPKDKQPLGVRLESFQLEEHLGAVNELSWWALMQQQGVRIAPLPVAASSRPDFHVAPPADYYVEVSTLNVSQQDQASFQAGCSVALNHAETIRRLLGKLTAEKKSQLRYAFAQGKAAALVVFDYTTWSGMGTHFFHRLGDYLLGSTAGFVSCPSELSAIVYVERKVIDGHIVLSRDRSAAYFNPAATHRLPSGTFPMFHEYSCHMIAKEPQSSDSWIRL